MDPNNQENKDQVVVTPEEQKAEEEALKGVKDEELREKLADSYGLDPDIDGDLLDKLVANEKSHREKLSGAIKQKINYREKLKGSQTKQTATPNAGNDPSQKQKALTAEEVDKLFEERMEKRDLEELNLPDELKEEVKKIAKVNGISVRVAAQDPYISFRKEQIEKERKIADATPKRKGKGSYTASYDPSKPVDPNDYDLSTEEGRKSYNDAKAARRKYQAEHQ